MECKNAYKKNGVRYILCHEVSEPNPNDGKSVAHAMCGHQRFCPSQNCAALMPSWRQCTRLIKLNVPDSPQEATRADEEEAEDKPKSNKKKPQKAIKTAKGEIKNNIV